MKKILITGQNSYIGNKFEEWVSQWPDEYQVTKISVRNDDWKNQNWSTYDVVLNVAGIAHQKITKENEKDYYRVNRDLATGLAEKAKNEGVSQFIQMSTMSVFGKKSGEINQNTPLEPKNAYGKSKLEADKLLISMGTKDFTISIVRPPMVYGFQCPGNYAQLSKLSKITPIFPKLNNNRSMIYINNLSEFLKIIICNNMGGCFYPQNIELVNTSYMVKLIAKFNKHKLFLINANLFVKLIVNKSEIFSKIFGDLYYEKKLSKFDLDYIVADFETSLKLIEWERI